MKVMIAAVAVLVLIAVSPSAEAAECSRMQAPSWEAVLEIPDAPAVPAARAVEVKPIALEWVAGAVAQGKRPAANNPGESPDHCPNWACWQDEWGCTCDGFWCGPIFVCGIPCSELGC